MINQRNVMEKIKDLLNELVENAKTLGSIQDSMNEDFYDDGFEQEDEIKRIKAQLYELYLNRKY